MDSLAFTLAVISALIHAVWNASLKGSRHGAACLMAAGTVQAAVALPLFLFLGAWEGLKAGWPFALAAAGIHVLYRLLLSKALQTGSLSQAYAVARSAPLLVALGGVWWLGEMISGAAWLGIGVMLAGVALLHSRELALLFRSGPDRAAAWSGPLWAFLTLLTVTAYSLTDKAGVMRMEPLAYFCAFTVFSMSLYGGSFPFREAGHARARAMYSAWREERPRVLGIALMEPLSYLLILFAFTRAPAGAVVAVRQLSVPLAALIGVLRFKEPAGLWRVAGALLVGGGAAVIRVWA